MFLNNSTHLMTYLSPTLKSTQQSTLAAGTTTLDNSTQANETMTSMGGQTLGNMLKILEEEKRNSPALVIMLPILGIFLAVLIFIVWRKRNQQSRQNSPGKLVLPWIPSIETRFSDRKPTTRFFRSLINCPRWLWNRLYYELETSREISQRIQFERRG